MVKFFGKTVMLIALLAPTLSKSRAEVYSWKFDEKGSEIKFTATQKGAPLNGKFGKFSGEITFDPKKLEESKVIITIDLKDITSGFKEVETVLKGEDWFDVKKYPEVIFKSNKVKNTGDKAYEVGGELTIRKKPNGVTLNVTVEEYSKDKARIIGSTTIKRSEFDLGLKDFPINTNIVENDVKIDFIITATK